MQKTNGFEFLRRTLWLTVVTSAVIGVAVASRWGWPHGSGFLFGSFWALANFTLLGSLLVLMTSQGEKNPAALAGLGLLKLGVLTAGGVALFKGVVPGPSFAAGIGWPLIVILLRSIGAQWWRRQYTSEARNTGAVKPSQGVGTSL